MKTRQQHSHKQHRWISFLLSLMVIGVSGCSSLNAFTHFLSGSIPSTSVTMAQAYQQALSGDSDGTIEAGFNGRVQKHLFASILNTEEKVNLTQPESIQGTAFSLRHNPSVAMYVYPHRVGADKGAILIPGYTTVFPLYTQAHYALAK